MQWVVALAGYPTLFYGDIMVASSAYPTHPFKVRQLVNIALDVARRWRIIYEQNNSF